MFQEFDKDKSGTISVDELELVMKQLGQNPTVIELQQIIEEVDTDGNGQIDFEEFVNLMGLRMNEFHTVEELNQAFKIFDSDGDNSISKQDLMNLMKKLGEDLTDEEIEDMIRVGDTTGD